MPFNAVNIGTNTGASGATLAITVPAAGVPAGSLIVVVVTEKSTSGTSGTLADTAGNTWNTSQAANLAGLAADGRGTVFFAFNSKALVSGNTITYTRNLSASSCSMSACYFTDVLQGANPEDTAARASATGTTGTITVTSGTPANAGDLFVGCMCASGSTTAGGNATFTQATGWLASGGMPVQATTGGSGGSRAVGGYLSGTGTTTHAYNPTLSSTAQQFAVFVTAFRRVPDVEQVVDLTPATFVPQPLTPSWTFALSPSALASSPIGEVLYDLPPQPVQQLASTWIVNLQESTLFTPVVPPDLTKIFRPHLRSLPDQPAQQPALSWTVGPRPMMLMPIGEQSFDLTPRPYEYHVQLRDWRWQYNPNLIGKDRLPTGDQFFDLTPRAPEYHVQLRTWQWSYNVNLIGKDRLPVGENVTDLTPRPYEHHIQLRSWVWSYNLNLVGKDRLPTRQQDWPLPIPPAIVQGWISSVNIALTSIQPIPRPPFNQFDWPLIPGAPRPDETWAPPLNLALKFPPTPPDLTKIFRGHLRSLPDQPIQPLLQTWIQSVNLALTGAVAPKPTAQYDWPLTPAAFQPERSITASYNKNLIGQDRLPNRQSDWPLTPAAQQPERTISASYNLNLIGKDKLPTGLQATDLPPRDFARLFQTWIQSVNLSLTTAPPDIHAQARQLDWPIPRGAEPDWRRSWEWSYNKNLIGQDQLPFRQTDWPNPIQPALVKDWIQSVNLQLLAPQKPFAQFDWPVPTAPVQPAQSWTAWYNLNLTGQDRLPIGKDRYDLWPSGPQQPDRGFGVSFNLNLRGQDRLPSRQSDWPLPGQFPTLDRGFGVNINVGLYFQPLTLPLSATRISDLAPIGYSPLLQQSIYEYNAAFIPVPGAPTLILRTLTGVGL